MRWSDIEEYNGLTGINVTQKKTGVEIWVPFTRELRRDLELGATADVHCLLQGGRPAVDAATSCLFMAQGRDTEPAACATEGGGPRPPRAALTAVVRLRRAGATVPQIADMVGMSELMVARYSRLSSQRENAIAAIHHLDARTKGEHPRPKPLLSTE